jgi:hypothetical protein
MKGFVQCDAPVDTRHRIVNRDACTARLIAAEHGRHLMVQLLPLSTRRRRW